MSMLWVIPCRFDPERPVVFDCVRSIRAHHPDDRILVVDSNSPDRTYWQNLWQEGAVVADAGNVHYSTNAYRWSLEEMPPFERYAFVHDSTVVHANLDHLQGEPLTTVRYFRQPPNVWPVHEHTGAQLFRWGWNQARQHMGIDVPGELTGVFGPMWFCDRKVCDDLLQLGLFDILPTDRFEAQCMERLVGVALTHLGYDVTVSLQGEMHGFFDQYDSTLIEKRHLVRD